MLGNSAVGKTSIFNRLTTNTYFEEGITTTSAFHKQIECPSTDSAYKLKVNLWDTAGQEQYQSLTEMYVRDAAGVIIVYDITAKQTFEDIATWMRIVEQHCDLAETSLALVGNKCDNRELQIVKFSDAAEQKKVIGAQIFLEVSAKENEGMQALLAELSKQLLLKHREEKKRGLDLERKSKKKGCCKS